MLTDISRLDEVRNDTLITKASGEALARLSEFYGFSWPRYIPEEDWRQALRRAVFAAKGTPGATFDFLNSMFNQWSMVSTIEGDAISPNQIELLQESQDFSALCNYVDRLAIVDGRLHYVTSADSGTGVITFADVNTSLFDAADLHIGDTYEVKLLPFMIEEHSCQYKLFVDGGIFIVPSTYLQEDGLQDQEEGEPPYGYLMDFFSGVTAERFGLPTGPFPAYLAADFFETDFFGSIFKLLAAGVQLRVQNIKWCEDTQSMYSSFTQLLNTGSADSSDDFTVVPDRV
jgi:hypothetical protein